MIKRLWQFPAVIGGTALLTFCGVSALQASINAPLHAFGAAVEAARASASASLSPTLVAAPPVQKVGGTDVQATPGFPQVQAAAAAQTSPVPQAAPAPAPAPAPVPATAAPVGDDQGGLTRAAQSGGQDVGSAQGDQGQGNQDLGNQDQGNQDPGNQDPGQQQGNPGDQGQGEQGQGDQGQGNGLGVGLGQSPTTARGSGSNAGGGQGWGQKARGAAQSGATGGQSGFSQSQLSSELNTWLRLVNPNLTMKGAQGGGSFGSTGKSGAGQQDSQQ